MNEFDAYEDHLDSCASDLYADIDSDLRADHQMELDAQCDAPRDRRPPLEDLYTAPHRPVLHGLVIRHILIRRPRTRGAGRPAGRRVACAANAPPGESDDPEPAEEGWRHQHLVAHRLDRAVV